MILSVLFGIVCVSEYKQTDSYVDTFENHGSMIFKFKHTKIIGPPFCDILYTYTITINHTINGFYPKRKGYSSDYILLPSCGNVMSIPTSIRGMQLDGSQLSKTETQVNDCSPEGTEIPD